MNKPFVLYKSIYFYITSLLKNKNISEEFLLSTPEDLLVFQNETSIDAFDYSALRIASSRLIVLSLLDYDKIKSSAMLSLLGIAARDEKEFQKQVIRLLQEEESFIKKSTQSLFIKHIESFVEMINDTNLIATPLLEKDIYKLVEEMVEGKAEKLLLNTLIDKRVNLQIVSKSKEDLNLKVITDFYSPLTTSPFAFQIVEEYNDFLRPIVDEVIKFKHILNLFEIITTFKITNWLLTGKWEE